MSHTVKGQKLYKSAFRSSFAGAYSWLFHWTARKEAVVSIYWMKRPDNIIKIYTSFMYQLFTASPNSNEEFTSQTVHSTTSFSTTGILWITILWTCAKILKRWTWKHSIFTIFWNMIWFCTSVMRFWVSMRSRKIKNFI